MAVSGRLWDTETWREVRRLESDSGSAFSPDGKILAVENFQGIVRLLDPESGREYARLEDPHLDRGGNLCFSHDGARLVNPSNDSSTVHVWDLRAIRDEIRKMGLDWDLPPYQQADARSRAVPLAAIDGEAIEREYSAVPDSPSKASVDAAKAEMAKIRRAYESAPNEVGYGRGWATLALVSGDAAEYRRACQALRDRFGNSAEWYHAVHVCWALMLSEDSVPDKRFLLDLGASLVQRGPELAWTHTSLAGGQPPQRPV